MSWGLIPTFVEVTGEKLVGGLFVPAPPILNRVKDMVAIGEFNLGNTLHMELAWYTFSLLLQYELDQVRFQWNTIEEQDMILFLEDQTSCSFYQNYLEVKTR